MLPRIITENRFAVVDIESTGVNTRQDEVIQVAIVQIDHGRPRIRASSFVQPKRAKISDGAYAKHGIDWRQLEHAPRLEEIAGDIIALIGDRCLLGFGINRFDFPMLQRQFTAACIHWNPAVLDVLTWERRLHKEKGSKHNLAAAAERWGVPMLQHHDALDDCRMTWNIFLQLALRFEALGTLALTDALTKPAEEPLPEGLAL